MFINRIKLRDYFLNYFICLVAKLITPLKLFKSFPESTTTPTKERFFIRFSLYHSK